MKFITPLQGFQIQGLLCQSLSHISHHPHLSAQRDGFEDVKTKKFLDLYKEGRLIPQEKNCLLFIAQQT